MPRFVILAHDWPTPHWDLLLEAGPVLRAWRLLAEPAAGRAVPAEPNADHRLHYLDYEGPVTGGRGTVTRWDAGTFDWLADTPDRVEVELRGARLTGRWIVAASANGFVFHGEPGA
ncbi:DNA polymerase ligase N-terminal domain-containing protein [Gemmata sp.]|uniref:DNA polymerase ligase N-terminal domain-containing protein n=1 Tax=Gemmata sp. TaxID=1914242 RepID=UPI003F72F349